MLKTAGRQAAGYLAQLEAAEALLVARQFESFNRMSAFVIHDLKNVVAQLSLLLANAVRHKNNPAFQEDMLETIGHAIDKMNRLLMQLRKGPQPIDSTEGVQLDTIIAQVLESKSLATPKPTLGEVATGLMVHADADRLERVVGHLVQNAIDACAQNGRVNLSVSQTTGFAEICVSDNTKVGDTLRSGFCCVVAEPPPRPWKRSLDSELRGARYSSVGRPSETRMIVGR